MSNPMAPSSACAASSMRFSLNAGPMSWKPTGRPSLRPHGMLIAGRPARLAGMVQMSLMYMASGSSVREPALKATVGDVGEAMRSTSANAASKSRRTRVRTFWARP